ncbi:cellulose binding domain-containing protein [Actinoplanes sp. NEAU-A12]|uniref:Cellulose binding domain-containing protein n=1 Tax=Actinoplanes sandaracinus TaxID=3045177 RepID=A0ABT6WGL8_9ACTN|nr:cellulose binding domain-containing protein [Actinoplanes sandaracinus]MDI6098873.1 cellulose binding domain-containing protein [Actinoplanes sandaracinus]
MNRPRPHRLAVLGAVVLATGAMSVPGAATAAAEVSAATCAAAYRTAGSWNGGFHGEVTVTNSGAATIDGWKVTMTLPAGATVGSLWNGVHTGATGTVTVTDAGYNGTLGAGRSVTFGFVATGSGTGTTVSCATGTTTPPDGVLDHAHTVGRVQEQGGGVRYTWPGTYFEGRFQGSGIGIVLDDAVNDYDVQIDGNAPVTLVKPGRTTHWINGLANGEHTVRLAKRTESPWSAGQFGGFVAGPGGRLLGEPAARGRQIEFIGDSWTAGYGNMSAVRDCTGTGGVDRNTNADRSFGALAARGLGADYQINAWSGMGMVRNYNGGNAGTNYRTYYDRTLQAVDTAVWQRPAWWKPQVVVIGLGINDFSTALNPGEPWADTGALAADYRNAYQEFLAKLRDRYGPDTHLVLTYPDLNTALTTSIEQLVAERNAAGDDAVHSLNYGSALGLDLLGCDWHPSLRDHGILAGSVTSFVKGLPLNW